MFKNMLFELLLIFALAPVNMATCDRYTSPAAFGYRYGMVNLQTEVIKDLGNKHISAIILPSTTQRVVIKNTPVETLSDDVFNPAKNSMLYVEFMNTKLSSIPQNSLKNLKNLTALAIKKTPAFSSVLKNQLDQLPLRMKYFFFEDNNIDYIEKDSFFRFTNLTSISFTGNNIQSIPYRIFPNTVFDSINLDDNHLTEIPIEALRNCISTHLILFLGCNNITHLPEDRLKPLLNMRSFNMDSNPLECGCEMKWLGTYFKGKRIRHGPSGRCVTGGVRINEDPAFFEEYSFRDCTN